MSMHFSKGEMQRRGRAAAQRLGDEKLDAILLFKQESMYWLTGYDTFGFSLFQSLIVDSTGNTTLFTRRPDLLQARQTSNVDDIRIWVDRDGVDPGAELVAVLRELGFAGKRIGVEFASYGLTAASWRLLEKAADGFCEFVDSSTVFDELRVIKSDEELGFVRRAAELADDALDAVRTQATPGAFEGDILASMQGAVFRGGGDYAGNEFIIGSGHAALLCRYFSGRRHLDADDQLTLEWAGAYRRYHAAMMRTVLTGRVDARHEAMYQGCVDALDACQNTIAAGVSMGAVFDAHASALDDAGFANARFNACGYGMGAVFNPIWVDPPMFFANNPLAMPAGSVFFLHMILMDESAGLAMTLGESVIVTDNGCERLSRDARDLIVNS